MAPWPHYPNKNVSSDRRNLLYDLVCLFRVRWKTVPVQVQQLQILYRRRCSHHNLQCTFDTLWTEPIVVAREHRQIDGGRWLWWNVRQRPMNERRNLEVHALGYWHSQCSWRSTQALCGLNVEYQYQTGGGVLNRLQLFHQSFRDTYRRTELQ